MPKKWIFLIIAVSLTFWGVTTYAFDQDIFGPKNVLPEDMDVVISMNTQTSNFLSDQELQKAVDHFIAMENETDRKKMVNVITEILKNNIYTYAVKFEGIPVNYCPKIYNECWIIEDDSILSFYVDDENFKKIVEINSSELEVLEYKNTPIYKDTWTDNFYTKLGNLLVSTHKLPVMKTLIDNYQNPKNQTLKNNLTYQISSKLKLSGNFINVFVDPKVFLQKSENKLRELASYLLEPFNQNFRNELEKAFETEKKLINPE